MLQSNAQSNAKSDAQSNAKRNDHGPAKSNAKNKSGSNAHKNAKPTRNTIILSTKTITLMVAAGGRVCMLEHCTTCYLYQSVLSTLVHLYFSKLILKYVNT